LKLNIVLKTYRSSNCDLSSVVSTFSFMATNGKTK
jgi:hypothetical protein